MIQRLSSPTKFKTSNITETEEGREEKHEEEKRSVCVGEKKKRFAGVRTCSYGVTEQLYLTSVSY